MPVNSLDLNKCVGELFHLRALPSTMEYLHKEVPGEIPLPIASMLHTLAIVAGEYVDMVGLELDRVAA